MMFTVLRRCRHNGETLKAGDTIESNSNLADAWPDRFSTDPPAPRRRRRASVQGTANPTPPPAPPEDDPNEKARYVVLVDEEESSLFEVYDRTEDEVIDSGLTEDEALELAEAQNADSGEAASSD